ncbi:short-chain dehydrogenase [Nocardia sp. MDA0666]|uniref:SDR family NAD(P)-dependent oxidoreductase n=1 Tax=Nocardia sp. MDA0666 TaxID=2135448 RepID=UPI000D12E287|nr:SDR family NAD(P)-dependent oxidoreductase [Nocardia sp. MDA0666]PSR69109.1 short-chain dehydrogenase [Nocardia sp. MDA0666]
MSVLDGRVVAVTGAGGGLGREHALLMAAEGAHVVVNDLRGAQQVADEITAAGGSATAVEGSIAELAVGEKLVDAAVDTFGNLHAVVNNAGIIRDAMLWNMTEEEFDSVVAVHLKGTFSATRAAARYWRAQSKAGVVESRTIVNTSSGSGLHGNYGQWNYSAAKAGLAIQAVNAARELERFGVKANAIAPVARTEPVKVTPGIKDLVGEPVDPDVFDRYNPANCSPLVAYLSSAECAFNGQVFAVYGGYVGLYSGYSIAHEIRENRQWEVGELAELLGAESFPKAVDTRRAGIPKVEGETK